MLQTLVVVAHWVHDLQPPPAAVPQRRKDLGEPADFWLRTTGRSWDVGLTRLMQRDPHRRTRVLLRTLSLVKSWPCNTSILLVSNAHVAEASSYISQEIRVERPRCSGGLRPYHHHWCLPWEAVRILCAYGNHGRPCAEGAGLLKHDVFVYLEDDVLLSSDSFKFWHENADEMYQHGFFLVPHCQVFLNGTRHLDPWEFPCESVSSFHLGVQGRQGDFFSFPFMSGRGFLMTKMQFSNYIHSGDWDWLRSCHSDKFWGMREGAYMAPLLRHSIDSVVSHPRLAALHAEVGHYKALRSLAIKSNRWPKCSIPEAEQRLGLSFPPFSPEVLQRLV